METASLVAADVASLVSCFTALDLKHFASARKICKEGGLDNIPLNMAIAITSGAIHIGDDEKSLFARLLSDQSRNINLPKYARRWSKEVKMFFLESYLSKYSKAAHERLFLNGPYPSPVALLVSYQLYVRSCICE